MAGIRCMKCPRPNATKAVWRNPSTAMPTEHHTPARTPRARACDTMSARSGPGTIAKASTASKKRGRTEGSSMGALRLEPSREGSGESRFSPSSSRYQCLAGNVCRLPSNAAVSGRGEQRGPTVRCTAELEGLPCESREVRNTTSTIARDSSDLSRAWHRLLNYAVCASEKRGRECEPHRSRCPGIDDQPELGRLFDRKIGG